MARVELSDVQKVYPTDEHSLIAIAGAAGPSIEMARIMRIELECTLPMRDHPRWADAMSQLEAMEAKAAAGE